VFCIEMLHQSFHTQPQLFYGPFFRDHPGEPVPEENFWTLWCKGRLTEADTPTIRLGATPSGLTVPTSTIPHQSFINLKFQNLKKFDVNGIL